MLWRPRVWQVCAPETVPACWKHPVVSTHSLANNTSRSSQCLRTCTSQYHWICAFKSLSLVFCTLHCQVLRSSNFQCSSTDLELHSAIAVMLALVPLNEMNTSTYNAIGFATHRERVERWLDDQFALARQDVCIVRKQTPTKDVCEPSKACLRETLAHQAVGLHDLSPEEAVHAQFDDMSETAPFQRRVIRQAALKQNIVSEARVCTGDRPNGKQDQYIETSKEWASALTACLEEIDGS